MNGIEIEITSANYKTDAVRRATASGSKHRPIGQSLKALFKQTVKAITGHHELQQPEARRRRGEKESGGVVMRVLPKLTGKAAARGRYAALKGVKHGAAPAASKDYADTGLYLADTPSWLQAWEHNAECVQLQDDYFCATIQDRYYPHPS